MRRLHWAVALTVLVGCSASNDKGGPTDFTPGGSDSGKPGADGGGIVPGDDGGFNIDGGGETHPPLDPTKDNDGDGYLYADDCNDADPLVNPGAFDVLGDGVDNDCNGKVDDKPKCDTGLTLNDPNALHFAQALGMCNQTTDGATGKAKIWGVISATLKTVDGAVDALPRQYGIEPGWGTKILPKEGINMAVLSTGSARMPGQPDYMKPLQLTPGDKNTGHENTPPPGWPKNSPGCPDPTIKTANDSVGLQLKIRVPTNAKGFSYDFDFYTSEYIDFVCTEFNDTYIALLQTKAPLDPKNLGNISFDKTGGPVNVNSGFFEVCTPGTSGSGKSFACPLGTSELAGTGFEGDGAQDGATSWLETKAPVVPGETITLQFVVWNTGDHILQTTVLLDNFLWDAAPSTAPSTDRPK